MSPNTVVVEKLKELCVLHKESVKLLGKCACYLTLVIMGKEFMSTNVNQQLQAHYEIAEEYNFFIGKCSNFLSNSRNVHVSGGSTAEPLLSEAMQLIGKFQKLIRKNKAVLDEVEQISKFGKDVPLQIN